MIEFLEFVRKLSVRFELNAWFWLLRSCRYWSVSDMAIALMLASGR